MSIKFKRKHQWTIKNIGREERKHINIIENPREEKSSEREIQKGRLVAYKHGDIPTKGSILLPMIDYNRYTMRRRHIGRGS